ncbi:MAG: hypothetical protein ACI85U_002276 [Candidatus Promineifilaceae bacterium]|jgi:hypothetical protein
MLQTFTDFIKNRSRFTQLFLIYLVSQIVYLWLAWTFLAPMGYYGSTELPRFADPWIARTETILTGAQLYKDVFTTTPPLTNYLMIPPGWFAIATGIVNPWATSGFMVYFSLFNLFTAWLLLVMFGKEQGGRDWGFVTAVCFLLNPLTFGNTVLRRQDESIIVFFMAVSLYYILRNEHAKGAIAIGVSMLVKLTGLIPLPIAFWYTKKWQYVILPITAFFIGLAPWLISVGRAAMFWSTGTRDNQHPFQFDGVSLGRLWNRGSELDAQLGLTIPSIIFVAGVGIVLLFVMWKRFGILEDFSILAATVLILSPKLHTGYFSILVLFMTPLVVKRRLIWQFFAFGVLALAADLYKWPIENFTAAFWIMVTAFVLLIWLVVKIAVPEEKRLVQFNPLTNFLS